MNRSAVIALLAALSVAGAACSKSTSAPAAGPTPSATGTAAPAASPRPGPEGTLVVFSTAQLGTVTGQSPKDFGRSADDLFLYGAGNNLARRLTKDGADTREILPRFRSATEITYVVNDESGARGRLFSLDLETGKSRRLLNVTAIIDAYDWSADGKSLVYVAAGQVFTFIGGDKKRLRAFSGGGSDRMIEEQDEITVAWSPDGTKILAANSFFDKGVMVLERGGALSAGPAGGTFARWAPGGDAVWYRDWNPGGRWRELHMDGGITELKYRRGAYRPSVSPDGRFVAYDDGKATPTTYVYDRSVRSERRIDTGFAGPIWLEPRVLAAVDAAPCAGVRDEPQGDCEITSPWAREGAASAFDPTGGTGSPLRLATTLHADVRPA